MTPRMSIIVQSAPKDDLQYLIFLPDYSTLNICIQFLADMEFLSLGSWSPDVSRPCFESLGLEQ